MIFIRLLQRNGLDKPLKTLLITEYSVNGAKRIRTADPLHAMQLVSTFETP